MNTCASRAQIVLWILFLIIVHVWRRSPSTKSERETFWCRCGKVWMGCVTDCNTLQHAATHCNALQHTATYCNTLQHTALTKRVCETFWCQYGKLWIGWLMHCYTLHHAATRCSALQHTAPTKSEFGTFWCQCGNVWIGCLTHCNTLQHAVTHCNALQYTATHCTNKIWVRNIPMSC